MTMMMCSIDLVLVPLGLVLMFGYHLVLLYRVLRFPHTTVIGFENHNKKAWVERMMRGSPSDIDMALGVISTSISASTTLASLSIALGSVIGAWVGSSSKSLLMPDVIHGGTSISTDSIKYIAVLACFLSAFTSFVQSTRCFVHASFLISTLDSDVPVSYVQTAMVRGGNFWTAGLRLLYLATALVFWGFGPVPMFASSVAMVITLAIFDTNTTPLHHFRYFHFSARHGTDKKEGTALDNAARQQDTAMQNTSTSSDAWSMLNQPMLNPSPTLL